MRLRTKMVGATTLALAGLTVGVQQWARRPVEAPDLRPALVRAPSPRAQGHHPAPPPRAAPLASAAPRAPEASAPLEQPLPAAPATPAPQAAGPASGHGVPEAEATPPEDAVAERHEVRALLLGAAQELASAAPGGAAPQEEPELPRERAELERVALEAGLPRVELSEDGERAARIDLSTGEGLEASQPLPDADEDAPVEAP